VVVACFGVASSTCSNVTGLPSWVTCTSYLSCSVFLSGMHCCNVQLLCSCIKYNICINCYVII
jgi:hypothetical protein